MDKQGGPLFIVGIQRIVDLFRTQRPVLRIRLMQGKARSRPEIPCGIYGRPLTEHLHDAIVVFSQWLLSAHGNIEGP